MSSVERTDHLHELMAERLTVVQNLLSLTQSHAAAASQHELAVTMSVLGRKDALIDRLQQIHAELESFRSESPELRVWRGSHVRRETQDMANQTDEILRKIVDLDGQTLRFMQENRDAIAAQLHHSSDSQSALQAYSSELLLTESQLDVNDL